MPSDYVFTVNLPKSFDFFEITKQQADVEFWSELLCIESDNNPNLGKQYPDPPVGNAGDNVNLAQCPPAWSPPQDLTQYQYQSLVSIQQDSITQPLGLPFPAFSSECNDQTSVGFLLPIPSGTANVYSTCMRTLSNYNVTSECSGAGLFTLQNYQNKLFFTGRDSAVVQSFTVVGIQYLSRLDGSLTAVDPNATVTSFDPTRGLCGNAVAFVNMTFYYTLTDDTSEAAPGYIEEAEMTFIVTDFTVPSLAALPQNVRVSWLPYVAGDQPVEQVNSGNPGYIPGLNVLAGTSATFNNGTGERTAISRLASGMPLLGQGAGGACDPAVLTSLRYNYNTTSTCSLLLTAGELGDFCSNETNNPQKFVKQFMSTLYPQVLAQELYFGIWGNSNNTNINEWIQVEVSNSEFQPTAYSAADNACSGVITGFDLQIVTGIAFASNNLQRKVLYANLCFRTGVWDFQEQLGITKAQRFFMNFSATFIPLPQQGETVKKPAPPLLIPLPEDIFYPFVATSGAGRAGGAGGGALLAATLAAAALLLLGAHGPAW